MAPRWPKMAPMGAQDGPRELPDGLRRAPRAPQDLSQTPLASHLGFQASKNAPKDTKMRPKWHPREPNRHTNLPAFPQLFSRTLGERTVHYLGPTFAQRVAPNLWLTKNMQKQCAFVFHICGLQPLYDEPQWPFHKGRGRR